ncbi:MAG: glycosyltransferase [Gemmatimonadetes bacterium]|nr:glycosyltransferase [Gemmatimonadota bacterium]
MTVPHTPSASARKLENHRAELSAPVEFPIVVHCHLRWSFVWQRPQQTHSRLAVDHPVLFLEEPVWQPEYSAVRLDLDEPWPNVTVAQPQLPASLRERPRAAEATVLELLREALDGPLGRRFSDAVHWLYTPLMEVQLDAFSRRAAVVYDCMDELSQFAHAPEGLIERERRLLQRSDLVFTGGTELYRSKSRLHPRVHAFGCGVDFEHFAAAADLEPAPEIAALPRPRFGYVGVIDERLDYDLLERVARANPDGSLVMVGPVIKVNPGELPRPSNVHYLGARPYDALPACLAGFDVCLMPFALNAATEFINPTKTLEYLATGKPVLSTPVREVVRNFGHLVHVTDRDAFVARLGRLLEGDRLDSRAGLETARRASWESVVSRMEELVEDVLAARGDTSIVRVRDQRHVGGVSA